MIVGIVAPVEVDFDVTPTHPQSVISSVKIVAARTACCIRPVSIVKS
jgi:hypothetical protein